MPDITTFNRLAEILNVDLNYFSDSFPSEPVKQSKEPVSDGKKLSWDMSRGNWVDADFSGLKNLNEKFSSSNMKNCKFIGSDLSGLLLKNNHVDGCDFRGSDFRNSRIQNSHFQNNLFNDCTLQGAEFTGSYVSGCDLSGADLSGMMVKSGGLDKCVISGAVWNSTSFVDSHLGNLVFEGTLDNCYFENSGFSKVVFQNVTLINTFFKNNQNLKRVKFVDCKADQITYEFLKSGKADLEGIEVMG